MFNDIAQDYDMLNHLMSLGIDRSWRRKALRNIVKTGSEHVLDVACGTGDFSIAIAKKLKEKNRRASEGTSHPSVGSVKGIDISEGMLKVMDEKVSREGLCSLISCQLGDGENLSEFGDNSFDCVTIAFGIRNFEDREKGLREALRVLKPGGRLVILELTMPRDSFVRKIYNIYFQHILPKVGGKISGDRSAYNYLPGSVKLFPTQTIFRDKISSCGFENSRYRLLTFGICTMFLAEKPGAAK
jgi:demethylmenaquinone methyltransferase/2-methoxy-6-polyprenyl-1,4-benzoquinol methylase